jgi:hypothetical protein
MKKTHVKIVLNKHLAASHVYINGEEVPGTSIKVSIDSYDHFVKAQIGLIANEVILEGDFIERKRKSKIGPVPPSKTPGSELPTGW